MIPHDPFRDAGFPDLLAAFADGELPPGHAERLDAWLATHPAAAADLETQRRLGRRQGQLWRLTAAREPSEATWSEVWTRIEAALAQPVVTPAVAPPRTARRRMFAGLALVAAGLLAAVAITDPFGGRRAGVGNDPGEVLAVAAPDDVRILRILDADAELLVVGEPPLRKPLVLASVEDVEGLRVVKDTDGMMPMIANQPGPNAPMIVAPVAGK